MTPANDPRSSAPARQEDLHHDGLAVHRRVRPDLGPETPLIVLVHGAMDRSASFGRVMRRLPEYETIAYDRRGYAGSRSPATGDAAPTPDGDRHPRPGRGTIADHGEDLLAVVDFALATSPLGGSDRKVVLIGHSLGGTVCLWLAATGRNPAASVGVYESPAPWLDDSYLRVGGGAVEIAHEQGNAAGAEFFYRSMIGDETFSRLRSDDVRERRADGDALMAELESLRDPLQAFELSRVSVPVVVGSGEVSSPMMRRNSALIADAVPTSSMVSIPSAAHGAHLRRPDSFADYVRVCVAAAPAMAQEGAHGD